MKTPCLSKRLREPDTSEDERTGTVRRKGISRTIAHDGNTPKRAKRVKFSGNGTETTPTAKGAQDVQVMKGELNKTYTLSMHVAHGVHLLDTLASSTTLQPMTDSNEDLIQVRLNALAKKKPGDARTEGRDADKNTGRDVSEGMDTAVEDQDESDKQREENRAPEDKEKGKSKRKGNRKRKAAKESDTGEETEDGGSSKPKKKKSKKGRNARNAADNVRKEIESESESERRRKEESMDESEGDDDSSTSGVSSDNSDAL